MHFPLTLPTWAGLETVVLHLEMCWWTAPSTEVVFSKENQVAPSTFWLSPFSHSKKNSVLLLIWKGWVFQGYLYSLLHCWGPLTPGAWGLNGWTPRTVLVLPVCFRKPRECSYSNFASEDTSTFKYRRAHARAEVKEKVKPRSRSCRHGIIKAMTNHLKFTLNLSEWNKSKGSVSQFCLTNAKSKPYLIHHWVSKTYLMAPCLLLLWDLLLFRAEICQGGPLAGYDKWLLSTGFTEAML